MNRFYDYVGVELEAVNEATEFLIEYSKEPAEEPCQII